MDLSEELDSYFAQEAPAPWATAPFAAQ